MNNPNISDIAINLIIDDADATNKFFVEIENDKGESIGIGERLETTEGYTKIRITVSDIINNLKT